MILVFLLAASGSVMHGPPYSPITITTIMLACYLNSTDCFYCVQSTAYTWEVYCSFIRTKNLQWFVTISVSE